MYVLRTLIFISCLFGFNVTAQVKSVGLSVSSSDYKPKTDAQTIEERLRNNIIDTSISVNQIKISDHWKTNLIFSRNTADYSLYRLYDTSGTNYTSLGSKLSEMNLLLDHVVNVGPNVIEIIMATNFGTTPLRKSNLSLAYLSQINSTNTISVTLGTQKQNLPKNYFQNPNNSLTPESRPTELDTNSIEIGFEHIYSSSFKNKIEISAGQRVQDRPLRYGLNLKNIYVLNDTMGLRFDLGYLAENRSEKLKSDLGYQDSMWLETKFLQSINTYFNYGFGYALEINKEYRKWSDSTEQLGNDQLLLDLNYSASKWSLTTSFAYAKYNTGQTGTNMKAGFEWKF